MSLSSLAELADLTDTIETVVGGMSQAATKLDDGQENRLLKFMNTSEYAKMGEEEQHQYSAILENIQNGERVNDEELGELLDAAEQNPLRDSEKNEESLIAQAMQAEEFQIGEEQSEVHAHIPSTGQADGQIEEQSVSGGEESSGDMSDAIERLITAIESLTEQISGQATQSDGKGVGGDESPRSPTKGRGNYSANILNAVNAFAQKIRV